MSWLMLDAVCVCVGGCLEFLLEWIQLGLWGSGQAGFLEKEQVLYLVNGF